MSSPGQVNEINVRLTGRLDDLDAKLAKAEKDIAAFASRAQAKVKSDAAKLGSEVGKIGNALTMSMAVPLTAIAAAAAKTAMDFDKAIAKVQGLAGVSAAEIGNLRTQVLSLAGDTARAPEELAKGLYFVESAGLKGARAMDVLKVSAQASAAGLGETQTIANAITSAMNAYGESALTATHATDIMIAAVTAGKMAPEDLAGALGKVLPIASAVGVSFADVTAAIASMSREGLNAQEGATALRQTLATLEHPSKQTREALRSVGLEANEVKKELADNLIQGLNHLAAAFNNNDEAMAKVFPNIRAFTGVLNLTGKQGEEVAKVFDEVRGASGNLGRAFEVASQTDAFKMEQAFTELKVAGVALGSSLSPIIRDLANDIRGLSKWFEGLSQDAKNDIVFYGKLAVELALGAKAIGGITSAIKALVATRTAVSAYWASMKLGATSTAAAVAAVGKQIALVTLQLGLAVAAVAVWSKVIGDVYKYREDANNVLRITEQNAAQPYTHLNAYVDRQKQLGSTLTHPQLIDKFKKEHYDLYLRDQATMPGNHGKTGDKLVDLATDAAGLNFGGGATKLKGANPLVEQTKAQKDALRDAKKAAQEYASTIADLRIKMALIGHEDDPVARLLAERKYGGDASGWSASSFKNILNLTKQEAAKQKAHDDNLARRDAAHKANLARRAAEKETTEQANNSAHPVGQSLIGGLYDAANKAKEILADRAEQTKAFAAEEGKALALLGKDTDLNRLLWEVQNGRFKDLTGMQKASLVFGQIAIDQKQAELDKTLQLKAAEDERTKAARDFIKEKQREIDLIGAVTPMQKLQYEISKGQYADQTQWAKAMFVIYQASADAKEKDAQAEKAHQEALRSTIQEAANQSTRILEKAALDLGKGFKKSFADIVLGFRDMLARMAIEALASDVQRNIGNWLGHVFGATGGVTGDENSKGGSGNIIGSVIGSIFKGRASGGVVGSNQPYWVGEEGPELFVPGSSGSVVNNGHAGGGGPNITMHIHTQDADSFVKSEGQIKAAAGRAIQHAASRNH